MRWGIVAVLLVIAPVGCGDDDGGDGGDPDVADAATTPGTDSSVPGQPDAGPSGTQGRNQFCEILQDGGPFCEAALDCCDDKVCRDPTDCPGSPGFIPCDKKADCPNNDVCCQIPSMTFCTKPSACNDYNGTELP